MCWVEGGGFLHQRNKTKDKKYCCNVSRWLLKQHKPQRLHQIQVWEFMQAHKRFQCLQMHFLPEKKKIIKTINQKPRNPRSLSTVSDQVCTGVKSGQNSSHFRVCSTMKTFCFQRLKSGLRFEFSWIRWRFWTTDLEMKLQHVLPVNVNYLESSGGM